MRSVALMALTLLLSGGAFAREAPGIAVGKAAPAIEGKKWFTSDGKAPEYKDKVLLIEFWFATWGACNTSVPHLKEIAKKYAKKGLVVVAPSLDAEETVKKFQTKHSIEEYALLSDAEKTAKAFGVVAYPTVFIVDKDGKVVWKGHFLNETADAAIDQALVKDWSDVKMPEWFNRTGAFSLAGEGHRKALKSK